MTIFIDDMDAPFGRMLMSHMWSDTSLDELHAMARRLGMRASWFQCKILSPEANLPKVESLGIWPLPHYDVAKQKKAQAIALGAVLLEYGTNDAWIEATRRGRLLHPQRAKWLEADRHGS